MKISEFLSENFQFLVIKFSIYLNKRGFVMDLCLCSATCQKVRLLTLRLIYNLFCICSTFRHLCALKYLIVYSILAISAFHLSYIFPR